MLGKTHQVGAICSALIISSYFFKSPTNILDYTLLGSFFIGADFGGLFPDIDHPESTLGKTYPNLSKVINSFGIKFNSDKRKNKGHRFITHTLYLYVLIISLIIILLSNLKGTPLYILNIFLITIPIATITYLYYHLIKKISFLKIKKRLPSSIHLILLYIIFYICFKTIPNINVFSYVIILGFIIGIISHLFLDSLTELGIPLLYPITNKRFRILKLKTGKVDNYIILIIIITTLILLFVL